MTRPFEAIRVLDFGTNVAGPNAAAMLSDFGASVIKVERPGQGDEARAFYPMLEGKSLMNFWMNRGKRSIAIPLDDAPAREALLKLIKSADVLIESFRPGVMKKFGLDYESIAKINPRIIYCSVSMFGQKGKLSQAPGYDLLAQAMSGMMDMTGYPDGPPQRNGFSICDYVSSHNAFGGIATALYHREKTGEGQHVDIGLFNVGFAMNAFVEMTILGNSTTRSGDHHKSLNPYGTFTFKHGSLIIICPTPKLWATMCKLMGREELIDHPNFKDNAARCQNIQGVVDAIEGWLNTFDDVETPVRLMTELGIPCTKVLTNAEAIEKAIEDDYNTLMDMELPKSMKTRSLKVRGPHIKLSKTPGRVTTGCPDLGEHSKEILVEAGYSPEEADKMISAWK